MPVALGHVGVGAGQQHGVSRQVRPRRPHLLPGDDPLVAVALGPGGERRQVRAGARLAEELAPHLLVAHDRRQEPQPLLLGAVGEQRRRGQVEPERVEPAEVERPQLLVDPARHAGREVEPAVLDRPGRHDQPRRAEDGVPRLVVAPGCAPCAPRPAPPRRPASTQAGGTRRLDPVPHGGDDVVERRVRARSRQPSTAGAACRSAVIGP